jgi:hypothetical protein
MSDADSTLLNSFFLTLDRILNDDAIIPNLTSDMKLAPGKVVISGGEPVMIAEDGSPKPLNPLPGQNEIPKNPRWSIGSLSQHFSSGNGEVQLPGNISEWVNMAYVKSLQSYAVKDYLSDPNVGAHKNDEYRIHLYGSDFFSRTDDDSNAFDFNFNKKLVFITNGIFFISKNIFKCFPSNAKIKICEGYNDGSLQWQNRDDLINLFDQKKIFLFVNQMLAVTRIRNDLFLLEHVSNNFIRPPTYVGYLSSQREATAYIATKEGKIPSVNPINLLATNTKTGMQISSIKLSDSPSINAMNLIKSFSYGMQVLSLEEETVTYYFLVGSASGGVVVKCLSYTSAGNYLNTVSEKIATLNVDSNFRVFLCKNYGQFEPNKHLFYVEKNGKMTAAFLTKTPEGSFSKGPDLNPSDPAYIFAGHTHFFDATTNKLHIFKIDVDNVKITLYSPTGRVYWQNVGGLKTNATVTDVIYDVATKTSETKRYTNVVTISLGTLSNNPGAWIAKSGAASGTTYDVNFLPKKYYVVGDFGKKSVSFACIGEECVFTFKIDLSKTYIDDFKLMVLKRFDDGSCFVDGSAKLITRTQVGDANVMTTTHSGSINFSFRELLITCTLSLKWVRELRYSSGVGDASGSITQTNSISVEGIAPVPLPENVLIPQ